MDEAPFNEQPYLIHLTEFLPDPKLMKAQSLVRTSYLTLAFYKRLHHAASQTCNLMLEKVQLALFDVCTKTRNNPLRAAGSWQFVHVRWQSTSWFDRSYSNKLTVLPE